MGYYPLPSPALYPKLLRRYFSVIHQPDPIAHVLEFAVALPDYLMARRQVIFPS
jgi:hypothetical protein